MGDICDLTLGLVTDSEPEAHADPVHHEACTPLLLPFISWPLLNPSLPNCT